MIHNHRINKPTFFYQTLIRIFSLGLTLVCAQGIFAQEIKHEASLPTLLKTEADGETRQMSPSLGASDERTFTVTQFQFIGNHKISTPELEIVVANYLNHLISFNQLKNATDDIITYYRKVGWLVRVILPEQEIVNGRLTIQILETNLESTLGSALIRN